MSSKLSIIIPAYNIENYIEPCLASVFAQTYTDLEVIAVDDGSADGTGAVLDRLAAAEPRLRVIHQENGGVTRARLRGVREASGEYIGFVDGDDEIEPDMYARLLANAERYGADISHCGYQMVFPSRTDYYYNTGRLAQQDRTAGLKDLLDGSFVEPGLWNKLFRRTLFRSLLHGGVMDLTIKNNEDLLMNFYLFREAESAVYEDFCPYRYQVRAGSACNAALSEHALKDPITVLRMIEREVADEPEAVRQALDGRLARAMVQTASMSGKDQPDFVLQYRREIRRDLRGRLPQILRSTLAAGDKCRALWAGLWPAGYQWVHAVYARVTRLDRIYEIC